MIRLALSLPVILLMACRSQSVSVAPADDIPLRGTSIANAESRGSGAQVSQLWPDKSSVGLTGLKEKGASARADASSEPDPKKEELKKLCEPIAKIAIAHPNFAAVADRMRQVMEYTGTQGAAIAIAHEGKIVWEQGFGWANREKKIPATPDTPFSMASISKPFTATAIMLLEEQGVIDLDAPINNYLGQFGVWAGVGNPQEATIRRVLSHRAGLPLHAHFYHADGPFSAPDPSVTMQNYAALITPPGERYQYSNLGYGVLGFLIAEVSGQSYRDFMREKIFAPLGLDHTDVGVPPKFRRRAAKRYHVGGERLAHYTVDHPAASSIYSSVHDLAVFGMFHLGQVELKGDRERISKERLQSMRQPIHEEDHYALGWGLGRHDGSPVFGHNGAMYGVSSILQVVPEQNLVIAIAGNSREMETRHHWLKREVMRVFGVPARSDSLCELDSKHPLFGHWNGTVRSPRGSISVELQVLRNGEVHATIGRGQPHAVRGVKFKDGELKGLIEENIRAEQAKGASIAEFRLRLRDTSLDGALIFIDPKAGVVSHWTRLQRGST